MGGRSGETTDGKLVRGKGRSIGEKKRKGRNDRGVPVYIYVCYLCLTQLLVWTKWQRGRKSVV